MEFTNIIQKEKVIFTIHGHVTTQEAIAYARAVGLENHIEVHHVIQMRDLKMVYTVKYISDKNKLNGVIFPFTLRN